MFNELRLRFEAPACGFGEREIREASVMGPKLLVTYQVHM